MRTETIQIQLQGKATGAVLQTYFMDASKELLNSTRRPAVLLMPGGAYRYTSDREAEPLAIRLNAMGLQVAVLRYSCAPAAYPRALLEAAAAFQLLKDNCTAWNIRQNRIFLMGCSAGAVSYTHLEMSGIILRNSLDEMATVTLTMRAKLPKVGIVAGEEGYLEIREYPRADSLQIRYTRAVSYTHLHSRLQWEDWSRIWRSWAVCTGWGIMTPDGRFRTSAAICSRMEVFESCMKKTCIQ